MNRHQGMTLIELIIFIVIVSVGIVGILSVFNVTVKGSADPVVRKQALAVAEAMLDEIMSKSFVPATYAGTDRAQFDDISDYSGYTQTGIKAIDGSAISGLESYGLSVTVVSTALSGVAAGNVKQITVTVTGGGNGVALTGYRTDYE